MPPAVIAAGIAAAGTVGTAVVQSNAAGKAARGQQKSLGAAGRLERDRDAEEKRRYDEQMAAWQRAYDAREAMRQDLLRRYGLGGRSAAAGIGARVITPENTGRAPAPGPASAPPPGGGSGQSLGSLMGDTRMEPPPMSPSPAPGTTPMPQGMSLADLSGWSDWRNKSYAS